MKALVLHPSGTSTMVQPAYCRGARDVQLEAMAKMGVIAEPTDDAWNAKRVEIGMQPTKLIEYFKP